jgi:hypothetical protein
VRFAPGVQSRAISIWRRRAGNAVRLAPVGAASSGACPVHNRPRGISRLRWGFTARRDRSKGRLAGGAALIPLGYGRRAFPFGHPVKRFRAEAQRIWWRCPSSPASARYACRLSCQGRHGYFMQWLGLPAGVPLKAISGCRIASSSCDRIVTRILMRWPAERAKPDVALGSPLGTPRLLSGAAPSEPAERTPLRPWCRSGRAPSTFPCWRCRDC